MRTLEYLFVTAIGASLAYVVATTAASYISHQLNTATAVMQGAAQ